MEEEVKHVRAIDYYPKDGKITFYKAEDSKFVVDKADEIHSENIKIVKRPIQMEKLPERLRIEFDKIVTCKLKEKYPRVWTCKRE